MTINELLALVPAAARDLPLCVLLRGEGSEVSGARGEDDEFGSADPDPDLPASAVIRRGPHVLLTVVARREGDGFEPPVGRPW